MAIEQSPAQLLKETHDKVNEIWIAFFGVPNTNDKGIYGEFKDLKHDYYNFKRIVLVVFGILIGSGAFGFGIFKLGQLLVN